ncbi:MAG: hypothetical protein LBS55_03010 [Prevotellaceae bacterium]|jgi:hypothetical protein|nr:hypothetical protein [Prevotellaceae bacterium]
MRQKIVFLLIALQFLFSCETKRQHDEVPIVEVGLKKLYLSEIKDYLQNLSPEDSLTILTDYVNRWAKKQAVLLYAENSLSKDEKNLTEQIDDYRTSLLTHKYEQAYIRAKMDTNINYSEIEQFYKDHPDNFQLPGMLVKVLYIKVSNNFKNIYRIRQLYRSNREKDIEELEKISVMEAEIYSTFNDRWVDLNEIVDFLPGTNASYENRVIRMRAIEDSDENYTYFIKVNDISMKGSVAPLEHVMSDIKEIILNSRKTNLIRQLENTIFTEAMNRNEIKFNRLK